MDAVDKQMQQWSSRLRDDLRIDVVKSNTLGTTISGETQSLSDEAKLRLLDGVVIPVRDRLDELAAFQAWMDWVNSVPRSPVIVRAQVVTQVYFCFVYLGESCFTPLRKEMPNDSAARKCCTFLLDNPVRAFRNAVAHSNWRYQADFSGLEFWARKGGEADEPMVRWTVSQLELDFWQAVARCTAYAALLQLHEWEQRRER
jgi:hypothetical protein